VVTNAITPPKDPTVAQRARRRAVDLASQRPVQRLVLYGGALAGLFGSGAGSTWAGAVAVFALLLLVATEGF
jgi:hypothetical protein